ncbi:MAG: tetratricopeptide repeat protein [Candidatus Eisenbacteria bacterium]
MRASRRTWATVRRCPLPLSVLLAGLLLSGCGVFRGKGDDPTAWTNAEIGDDVAAWTEAKASLEAKAESSPTEPYWLHRIAELELEAPSFGSSVTSSASAKAEVWLHRALDVDPGYAPSLTLLSKLLYEQSRHFEAIELLERALEEHVVRGAAEVRACLALHQVASDDVAGAEATLSPLESRGEHWASVGSVLTYTRLQGDRYREAPRWAERALEAEESAANCTNYGIALLQEGKPKEAEHYFLRALELEPEQPGALYNLAIVEQFYFFDAEEGAAYYRRYRETSDDDPDGLAEVFGEAPESLRVSGGNP